MIERLMMLALSLAPHWAIADPQPKVNHPPRGGAMDDPMPQTGSMAQLAAEQAGSFAEQLEAIRVTQGQPYVADALS